MLYKNEQEQRAYKLIYELNQLIKDEQNVILETQSKDRKTGCEMRINMAIWGINLLKHVIK